MEIEPLIEGDLVSSLKREPGLQGITRFSRERSEFPRKASPSEATEELHLFGLGIK